MKSIMTALAPLESRHPRLGQSLWWLWVMRPQCLHAHAAPAGVLVQYVSRIFMQMPVYDAPTIHRPYHGMVDTVQCWAPSLSPHPHAPTYFASCATCLNRFDPCTGRHQARPNHVAGMNKGGGGLQRPDRTRREWPFIGGRRRWLGGRSSPPPSPRLPLGQVAVPPTAILRDAPPKIANNAVAPRSEVASAPFPTNSEINRRLLAPCKGSFPWVIHPCVCLCVLCFHIMS